MKNKMCIDFDVVYQSILNWAKVRSMYCRLNDYFIYGL